MNTPAHLLLAASAFAKPDSPKTLGAAMLGGLAPDLSLYILASFSLFILGNPESYVFGTQYFSTTWQNIFKIDNSFLLWGALLAIAYLKKRPILLAFAGGAFLHLCFDFPLHHDDARQHFWPVSDWIFTSPISYWDIEHYGAIGISIELVLIITVTYLLWRRYPSTKIRLIFFILALLEIVPYVIYGVWI